MVGVRSGGVTRDKHGLSFGAGRACPNGRKRPVLWDVLRSGAKWSDDARSAAWICLGLNALLFATRLAGRKRSSSLILMGESFWIGGNAIRFRQEVPMQAHREDGNQSTACQKSSKLSLVRDTSQDDHAVSCPTPDGLPFRLVADFVVEVNSVKAFLEEADLTAQQRSFFIRLSIPEAFNRMCRLALVSDLETDPGKYFESEFEGPEPVDILNCALPYLSPEEREYWIELQRDPAEHVNNGLLAIFMEFRSSLKRVVIQDMTTGETIPTRVGSRFRKDGSEDTLR